MAKAWLQTCISSHQSCQSALVPAAYPSRLLDVSDEVVRLVITRNRQVVDPYATLSHCWGQRPFFKLTPYSLERLCLGLQRTEFPKSFADAMLTACSLGIKWLWIDCYCILQGDDESSKVDWSTESVLMSRIYANAMINIGVSHASNPYKRAFVSRDLSETPRRNRVVDWRPTRSHNRSLYQLEHDEDRLRPKKLKLFERAWCVQERFLATRMLHFGLDQLYWECNEPNSALEACPNGNGGMNKYMPFAFDNYWTTFLRPKSQVNISAEI
jgi:hypothetical protein